MAEQKKYELAIVSGVEGACAALNNYRIAGPKPWGGGQVMKAWRVTAADLLNAVPELLIEERARIRQELLEAVKAGTYYMVAGLPVAEPFLVAADLRAEIDRICPEKHVTPPAQEAEEPPDTSSPAPRD